MLTLNISTEDYGSIYLRDFIYFYTNYSLNPFKIPINIFDSLIHVSYLIKLLFVSKIDSIKIDFFKDTLFGQL